MTEEKRTRGRPKGTKLSDETKRKIGAGVKERRGGRDPVPPGDCDLDTRTAVFERDEKRCVGCHETYVRDDGRYRDGYRKSELDMKIHRFAAAGTHDGLEAYATLCGDCRVGIRRGTRTVEEFLQV